MADLKISELPALVGADLLSNDLLVTVDTSASETKKLTVGDLIANGVTLIADDTIPGAKILFAAGAIATADLADSAITEVKLGPGSVTAAKLANESTVDLVTTLPASGAFTGQLALDTDDNFLYCWNGSAWVSLKAAGSINTVAGSTVGLVNITVTTSGSTVTGHLCGPSPLAKKVKKKLPSLHISSCLHHSFDANVHYGRRKE